MLLHVVGHNQRFRLAHMTFRRSIETISRYFREVLYAVGELGNEMILPPSTATPTKIRDSHRWYPYFKVSHPNTPLLIPSFSCLGFVVTNVCPDV
jgi:hypothetical protein